MSSTVSSRFGNLLHACVLVGALLPSATAQDAASWRWVHRGDLNVARARHTATLLTNGKVLVAGGYADSFGTPTKSAELYDPATETWSITGDLSFDRAGHTATLLPNGKVLVVGGSAGDGGKSEVFNPTDGTWSLTEAWGSLGGHTATLLNNGKVLVAGGFPPSSQAINSCRLYDPDTGTWSLTGGMQSARGYHTATLLPDGSVLAAGGASGPSTQQISLADLYDPVNGTWASTGALKVARFSHTATLMSDGRVLVACGTNSNYNPTFALPMDLFSNNVWSQGPFLNTIRTDTTATLLQNNKVLFAGGQGNGTPYLTSTELCTPGLGAVDFTWANGPSLHVGRSRHTATLLPDGTVLVVGGTNGTPLASTEVYRLTANGDFGGDGKADILFRHPSTGDVYLWLME